MEHKQRQIRFQVILDGIPLSSDQQRAIREGIQKVVMNHLAEVDLGGDRAAAMLALGDGGGNGGTQGIAARAISKEDIPQAFPGISEG